MDTDGSTYVGMYHIELRQRTTPDDISVLMQRKQAIFTPTIDINLNSLHL